LPPSLVRRLTLGFFLSHAIALSVGLLALWPLARMDEEDHVGPDVALSVLAQDVGIGADGRLALTTGSDILGFQDASPNFWFIARGAGQELRFGQVPLDIVPLLMSPAQLKNAELADIGRSGLAGEASILTIDTSAGPVRIATGGVEPESVTFERWFGYFLAEGFLVAPLLTALFTLIGGLVAIPIVIRSIRPTTRAAEQIDPSDLAKRLPEQGVVKELLPLVAAVNAALERLGEAFARRKRFIADVAHELRTPLAILNMHVEAMPEGTTKANLQRTVFRLGHMVGQMLDAERLTLAARHREQVDLVELGREAVANIAPLAVANGYDVSFGAAVPQLVVEGDPHAIARALANLLGNAVAHGGGEAGSFELRVTADGRVEVSDEGPRHPGRSAGTGVRAVPARALGPRRLRLGLHLVREIMRAHGGEAAVVGSLGGATIRLSFPPRALIS
jgi:signal transduction histidine kinase